MKSVIDTIGGFGTYFGLPTIFLKLVEKESYIYYVISLSILFCKHGHYQIRTLNLCVANPAW